MTAEPEWQPPPGPYCLGPASDGPFTVRLLKSRGRGGHPSPGHAGTFLFGGAGRAWPPNWSFSCRH